MAIIIYSGGMDSTVLAYDIIQRPYAYGLTPAKDEYLRLVTFHKLDERPLKNLSPILASLSKEAAYSEWAGVDVTPAHCPLLEFASKPMPEGGHATHSPLLSKFGPDRSSLSVAPGLHQWIASIALNVAAVKDPIPANGPRSIFFGFQADAPFWEQWDEAPKKLRHDASPAFVDSLNKLVSTTPIYVKFRAPFLENRMDKLHVVKLGLRNGVPFSRTSSCVTSWNPKGCGLCYQCVVRAKALTAAGVTP